MLRAFTKAILTAALLAVTTSANEKLCALPTKSLTAATAQYPELANALELVREQAIATWYTDRESSESCANKVKDIVSSCDEDSRVTLVVYGLPNKDCDAGYSASGSNKNADDYKKWIQQLADGVGNRKALYVLEPDAVGLLAKGGCGVDSGYAENVKAALEILSKNPNADIYMDLGYWTLLSETDAASIAKTVKELTLGGRLKGVALNTSNYRSNQQISELCANFQKAYGDNSLHCIADTSRNYNTSPPSAEWCNAKFGGIGQPPTSKTGFDNLDYFIWVKPAGESDGTCDGSGHTEDAMVGPAAGSFFKDHFVQLWNNGYFVKQEEYPKIGTVAVQQPTQTDAPTSDSPTTDEPTSDSPTSDSPTTDEPTSDSPTTDAPTSDSPTADEPTSDSPTSDSPTTDAPTMKTDATESDAPDASPQTPTTTPAPTDPVSDSPIANPSQLTPTKAPTPAPPTTDSEEEASPTPVASLPATTVPPATTIQVAAMESGERANDAATPVPSPAVTKKTKKAKKCESGLEPLPEEAELVPGEVKTADDESTNSTTNALSESHEAPAIEVGLTPQAQEANTKSDTSASAGLSGGVVAVIVIAGVVAVAVAAVASRRRAESRRRANTLRTPVEPFGELRATPAQVTVL